MEPESGPYLKILEIIQIFQKNAFLSILTTFDHFLTQKRTEPISKNPPFSILGIRIPAQTDPKSAKNRPNYFFPRNSDNFRHFDTHGIFWLLLSFEHYSLQKRVKTSLRPKKGQLGGGGV